MPLKLGPVRLRNPYILSPLEGVSDVGFRSLCSSLGASLAFTEMVRGAAFARENRATLDLVDTYEEACEGSAVGVQFITKGPEELKMVIGKFFELRERPEYAHLRNVKAVDLNFGCPSEDIIRVGLGPAMLKRAARMEAMMKVLKEEVKARDDSVAVGIKVRLGLNQLEKDRKVLHRIVEPINSHLDYVTVHAKHAGQRGSEAPDWDELKELRERITVPFIGNGGAFTADDARRMMRETRVDGVMVSRGAIRNPWVFRALAGEGAERPSSGEVETALAAYREAARRHRTKSKYLEFHEENFLRMLTEAKEREGNR